MTHEDLKQEEVEEEVLFTDEKLIKVYPDEIYGKFRSKKDIYNYLSQRYQLFLPPYHEAKLGNIHALHLNLS